MENIIDLLLVFTITASAVIGLWRGAIKEIITLISWSSAGYLAYNFNSLVAESFTSIQSPQAKLVIGFAVVLVSALILGALISKVLHAFIGAMGLGSLDKALGFIFGVTRGVLISVVGILISKTLTIFPDEVWQASKLILTLDPVTNFVAEAII